MDLAAAKIREVRRVSQRDVAERIRAFNAGRDPQLVHLKFSKLADNPFSFFRGTAHLFHEDFPRELKIGPASWACADLHLENFGSFRGGNGLTYFDVNDFDEAVLSSPLLDPARYLTSLYLGVDASVAASAGLEFLKEYRHALITGTPGWVERATARGVIRDLLRRVRRQRRRGLLAEHLELGHRRIAIRQGHTCKAPATEARQVARWVERAAKESKQIPRLRVFDVARRIVGTGSLGVARWIILAERTEDPRRLELLDLKEALPSAAEPFAPVRQPLRKSQAARIVIAQRRMQASAPRRLSMLHVSRRSFVLRSLQPRADKLKLAEIGSGQRLMRLVRTAGQIVAWNQLRSSGRCGSATADSLLAWGADKSWDHAVLAFAASYRLQVARDWEEFRSEWKRAPDLARKRTRRRS